MRVRETIPFLLCWFAVGCRESDRIEIYPSHAIISGSSMAPTLLGTQRLARCERCQKAVQFSDESVVEDRPTPCPRCGLAVLWEGLQSGQTVTIQPFDKKGRVKRGEVVVMRDRDSSKLEVKRVIGFPNESVRISDGDVWIDGRRFQKSISQFASLAIQVDRWLDVEGQHCPPPDQPPTEHCYASYSLWPRTGEQLKPSPSPILDEYLCNAAESRQLVPVRDIGLKLAIIQSESLSAKIEVRIWVDGAIRCAPIELSPSGVGVDAVRGPFASDSATEIPWQMADSHHTRTLMVAMVDGRLLVGTERSGYSLAMADCLVETNLRAESECSSTRPISLTVLEGRCSIMQAFIVRDIHYRGSNGEDEFSLGVVDGYHLLGDNVSSSSDSRQRWPDGVPAELILGRVEVE